MARRPVRSILVGLLLIGGGAGCASWRDHRPADATALSSPDDSSFGWDLLEDLANVSLHNWNFKDYSGFW